MDLIKLFNMKLTKELFLEKNKEDMALMILLWKDFKGAPPEGNYEYATIMAIKLADAFDVKKEFEELLRTIPPLKIIPK